MYAVRLPALEYSADRDIYNLSELSKTGQTFLLNYCYRSSDTEVYCRNKIPDFSLGDGGIVLATSIPPLVPIFFICL
jgi:hypothetical protein